MPILCFVVVAAMAQIIEERIQASGLNQVDSGELGQQARHVLPNQIAALETKQVFKRLETSSSSLKGSHLIKFMIVLLF